MVGPVLSGAHSSAKESGGMLSGPEASWGFKSLKSFKRSQV